jgi:hypothetical protein
MTIETELRGLALAWRKADPYTRVQIDAEIARLRAILARRAKAR